MTTVRSRGRASWIALVAVLLLGGTACASAGPAAPSSVTFGVLEASCDPERVAALRSAGVELAVVGLEWALAEPEPGVVDRAYLEQVRSRIATCVAGDMRVVLGLGLNNPPPWVLGLPDATFVNQFGEVSADGEPNLVFSAAAQQAAVDYLREVASVVGFDDVVAIRLVAELGYPGPGDDETGTRFWAFDEAAQGGPGLANGMSPSPMPGWIPGEPTWQDAPVTRAQIDGWYDWYTRSLADSVVRLADTLRSVGFTGDVHVPVAGRGVLPKDRDQAVATGLDGRGDPDGNLGRGLDYPHQFAVFAEFDGRLRTLSPSSRLVVDYTGLDDDTATRARAATAPQDTCHPGDTPELLTRTGLDRGAAQRWTIANARAVGLPVVAENPGPPYYPFTGGSRYSDSEAEQLVQAARYIRDCRLEAFFLAFEKTLYEGNSGVGVDDYRRLISGFEAGR